MDVKNVQEKIILNVLTLNVVNMIKDLIDAKREKLLEELDKDMKDNPCDYCCLKYIDSNECLKCEYEYNRGE